MRRIQLKRRYKGGTRRKEDGCVEEQREQPVLVGGDGTVAGKVHGRLHGGYRKLKSSVLLSFHKQTNPNTPLTLSFPSLTSFLHLAFFLFSKTDRTREACESKDERPGEGGVC